MSLEFIGIIAAAISLGALTLATNRGIRNELSELRANNEGLRKEIKSSSDQLRTEIGALREETKADIASLREETKTDIANLREEMQAGFKELHLRISNLAGRVSKVEGIIEGLFWGSRNRQPERSREGAA